MEGEKYLINDIRVTAPSKGKISYNGSIAGFHPELTGRENVYLNGAILGMTKAEIDAF